MSTLRIASLAMLASLASAMTLPQVGSLQDLSKRAGDTYTYHSGDGTVGAGWPDMSSWTDFDSMWNANLAMISSSCAASGVANNSDDENNNLKAAIQQIASDSGVDNRFILAVVMEESTGCVRVPPSFGTQENPGLMQDFAGTGSCNDGGGNVQNPCPNSEIVLMIREGTEGTSSGPGLQQDISSSGATDVSKYYKAAVIYNSGSINSSGELTAATNANPCYASDIANRVTGWVNAATKCNQADGSMI